MAAITGRRITVARASRPPPPDLEIHHPLSKTSTTPWPTKTVADIIIDRTGGQIKIPRSEYLESGAFPVIDQGREFSSGFTNSESQLYKGGLPIVLFGDHTREVKFISEPFALGADGVKALQPKPGLEAKYLYYYLLRSPVSSRGYSRHFKFLKAKEIPLPPLPEQHRIVEILDQADALRRQRRDADALSQRILPALFQEMFGDQDYSKMPLSKILQSIQGGWSPVCENRPVGNGEWGILKLGAATWCEYRPQENKALRADSEPRTDLEVRAGDLLFTRKNTRDLVGATTYVFQTPPRLMTPDLIFRLIPNLEFIDSIYLWQAMIQPESRDMIRAQASGAAASMVNISQNRLLPLEFSVPPLGEQKRFANAVNSVNQTHKAAATSATTLETLFQTLLHRAFDGSLTAKWRQGYAKEVLQELKHQTKA